MQTIYRTNFASGYPGMLEGIGTPRVKAYKNNTGVQYASSTITTPATPTNSQAYTLTINGISSVFTSDASATAAEIFAGVLAAVRASAAFDQVDVLNVNSGARTFLLRSRRPLTALTVAVGSSPSSNNVAFSTPTTPAAPSDVPFGRIVARASTDAADSCKLPAADTDIILGVAQATYAEQRQAVGPNARPAYYAYDAVDVIQNTITCEGVWIPCIEDIAAGDTIYARVSGANAGMITTTASGNIALAGLLKAVEPSVMSYSDKIVLCVASL